MLYAAPRRTLTWIDQSSMTIKWDHCRGPLWLPRISSLSYYHQEDWWIWECNLLTGGPLFVKTTPYLLRFVLFCWILYLSIHLWWYYTISVSPLYAVLSHVFVDRCTAFFKLHCFVHIDGILPKGLSMVSCQKGPIRHASALQIGPFWQDTLDISHTILTAKHNIAIHANTCPLDLSPSYCLFG